MQSSDNESDAPPKQKLAFRYEYFLDVRTTATQKHEFQEWIGHLNSVTPATRMAYLTRQFETLQRTEFRNKTVCSLRIVLFVNILLEELTALVKNYNAMLGMATPEQLAATENSLYLLTTYYQHLETLEDFKLPLACDKTIVRKLLEKFDEAFLYTNNMRLLLQIAKCFRSNGRKIRATQYNFVGLDLSLPDNYYYARLEALYKKYERFFSLKETPALVAKSSSSKDQLRPLTMKRNSSSRNERKFQLQALTLQELLDQRSIRKVSQHLEREYMTPEDKIALLLSLKSMALRRQFKQQPSLRNDFLALHYSFVRSDVLEESELALPGERQVYEDLLVKMLPQLATDESLLQLFLQAEPVCFLERPYENKRTEVGQIELFVAQQIDLIEQAFRERTLPTGLVVPLLKKDNLLHFVGLVLGFVYSFDSIFSSTNDVAIYKMYVRMLDFVKRCYLSFAGASWNYSLELMVTVGSDTFKEFHMDIEQDIKELTRKLIQSYNHGKLPVWRQFEDGEFKEYPVSKLECFQAIRFYLKDCSEMENNFLEFDEAVPTDVESSMLMIELVRIRFHDLEPNEQQKKFYRIVLEECMRHNVNPRFRWFQGFDYKVDAVRRSEEFELERTVNNTAHRNLIRQIINLREFDYCNKAVNDHNINDLLESLKFARGFRLDKTEVRARDDMVLFETMEVMSNLLTHPIELVDSPPENEIISQHLYLLLTVYNQRVRFCFDSRQYDQLYYAVLVKWLDTPYALTKAYREKYPNFFQDFLYITKLVEIADHIIELMDKGVETRDGLIAKLRLLQEVIVRRNSVDKSAENRAIMVNNLAEITIKFMSILSATLNADVYMNLAMLLWQVHGIMANGQSFAFAVVFDPAVLNKLDVWRHYKTKCLNDKDFLAAVADYIVNDEPLSEKDSLSENNVIKLIDLLYEFDVNVRLTSLKERYSKANLDEVPSGKLLLVIHQLLKDNAFGEQQTEVLNLIATTLSKRKPQFNIVEPNLSPANLLVPKGEGFSEDLTKMIKAGGDSNVETWLELFRLWKSEEEVYNFAIALPATLNQIKKVVSLKAVLKFGCGDTELEVYLKSLLPLIGSEEVHRSCEVIVGELSAEMDRKDEKKDKTEVSQSTYLLMMLVHAAKASPPIREFLIQNLKDINYLHTTLPIKDAELLKAVQKGIVYFGKELIGQYKHALGSLKGNLLKMDASERAINKQRIDYAFRLVSWLPPSTLNLCKESEKKEDQENWESEEQQKEVSSESEEQKDPEEKEKPKKKKKNKKPDEEDHKEESNESNEEDHSEDDDNDEDNDDDEGDGEEIDKDEITQILLEMRAGYKEYLSYLTAREELDVLIRGDYEQLEKDFHSKSLTKEKEDLLRHIVKLLETLGTASKRIIEKMNPNVRNIVKDMGLKAALEVEPPKDDPVATKIKPFDKHFEDSDFNESQDNEEDDDDEDIDDENTEHASELVSEGEYPGLQVQGPQQNQQAIEQEPQEEPEEEEKEAQEGQLAVPNAQNNGNVIEIEINPGAMSIEEVLGQLFGGGMHHKRKRHVHLEDEQFPTAMQIEEGSLHNLFEQALPGERFLTEEEFERTIELALYKMFDASDLTSLVQLHQSLIQSKFCCSVYANSIFTMLRVKEQTEHCQQLHDYPMISRDYEDTQSSLTMYERFLRVACKLLDSRDPPNHYTEHDPPIQVVQALTDKLKQEVQPTLITLALVLMTNQQNDALDDELIENIVRRFKFQNPDDEAPPENNEAYLKIHSKHIATLCRAAYRNEYLMHVESQFLDMFIGLHLKKILKIFMQVGFEELGRSTYEMHKKIQQLQKDILTDAEQGRDNRADITNILNDLTRTYFKKFDVFYYTFKHLLRGQEHEEESAAVKSATYDSINNNEVLNKIVSVALHHLNFYQRHLLIPDKPMPRSLSELFLNELLLVNIAFMVFTHFDKTVELDEPMKIQSYLDANLTKPANCPYKSLDKTISLVLPLLSLDLLCVPKYQRVLLPPIFEKPERGYHLPVTFRLIELNTGEEDSQMLQIRRGCSFDLAFYQLRRSSFRIEYYKEEGNDQGGLRREFMLGWNGFGIGEEASFIGRILAIAFRDNMLYGGRFDIPMALALTGYKLDLQFVKNDDPELYKNLSWMLTNPVAELEQDFTNIRRYYDIDIKVDLKPNGKDIPVTDENKLEYIDLLLRDKYFGGRQKEMEELRKGFFSIVPEKCVRILTPNELLDRISGVDTFNGKSACYAVEQLKKNVTYEGYSSTSEIVQWFWQELASFDFKERQTFLHFLTGTYKLPRGLKNYSFTLERVYDTNRLPVAHTCFNTLDLPEYTTYNVFRDKFRTAVFESNDNYGIM